MIIIIILIFSYICLNKKKHGNVLSKYLYLIYILSFLASFTYDIFWPEDNNYKLAPIIYLILILVTWFKPFDKITEDSFVNLIYNKTKLKYLSMFLILFLIPATLYFGYFGIITLLKPNLSTIRIEGDLISELPPTILNNVLIYISSLYTFCIILYFIALKDQWGKKYEISLFISSLSFVMLTLCFAGRDGILFWGINFFIIYNMFKFTIPQQKVKSTKRLFLILMGLGLTAFLSITFARFYIDSSSDSITTIFQALLSYLGQQTGNFCDAFDIELPHYNALTPALNKLLGIETDIDFKQILINQNAFSEYNVFGFFVKTFIFGYGKIGTIILTIVFYFFTTMACKSFSQNKKLVSFLILYLLFQIPMNGVFYYRQGVGGMDVSYIFGIIICGILNLNFNGKKI